MKVRGSDPTLTDLGKYQMVMARCSCGHAGPVRPSAIPKALDPTVLKIWELPRYLKCTQCGRKRASVGVMTR